jgi:hypothetical protein
MPRPAPTPPDFDDDDDLTGWNDADNDAENRPAAARRDEPQPAAGRGKVNPASKRDEPPAKREAPQPAPRRAKADPALAMPPVQKEESLGLGGKKPAPREPSLSAGEPLAPEDDFDSAPVLEAAPSAAKPSSLPDSQEQKVKRAARASSDVGGLLYLIALAIFAAALSAAVVLMFF